jgi:hypothetical protein
VGANRPLLVLLLRLSQYQLPQKLWTFKASFAMAKVLFAFLFLHLLVFSTKVQGGCQPFDAGNNLTFSHDFEQNFEKIFSWSDPLIQIKLLEGRVSVEEYDLEKHLDKRSKLPKVFGPAFKLLSCIGCAKAAGNVLQYLLSTSYLKGKILLTEAQLQNRCVFYTSRQPRFMNPADPRDNLSKYAAIFACSRNLVSIWASFCYYA